MEPIRKKPRLSSKSTGRLGEYNDLQDYTKGWLAGYDRVMEYPTLANQDQFNKTFIRFGKKQRYDGLDGERWKNRILSANRDYRWTDEGIRTSFADNLRGSAQTGDLHLDGAWVKATEVGEAIASNGIGPFPSPARRTGKRKRHTIDDKDRVIRRRRPAIGDRSSSSRTVRRRTHSEDNRRRRAPGSRSAVRSRKSPNERRPSGRTRHRRN